MHPLNALDFTTRVAKRAQYEAFEFSIDQHIVHIRNESHADPENHEYRIEVADGIPVTCSCPYDARTEMACKHRVAVAIRRPILAAVRAQPSSSTATDGGTDPTAGQLPEDDDVASPRQLVSEECSDCLETFPCWECYRSSGQEMRLK